MSECIRTLFFKYVQLAPRAWQESSGQVSQFAGGYNHYEGEGEEFFYVQWVCY